MSSSQPTRAARRSVFGPVHIFMIGACTTAGCIFVYKLFQFFETVKRDELAGFAFDPLLQYGFVAAGFLFLLAWAYLSGQFRDVERPKYEMFERFAEQEHLELDQVLDRSPRKSTSKPSRRAQAHEEPHHG